MSQSTPNNLRVLFLGHCSYFHVRNIARILKAEFPGIYIAAANPIRPDGKKVTSADLDAFDEFIEFPRRRQISLNPADTFRKLLPAMKDRDLRGALLGSAAKLRFKKVTDVLDGLAEEEKFAESIRETMKRFDLFHVHFIGPESLVPLNYASKDSKIILHVWGSDLLNQSGARTYELQYNAIERADRVVVNTSDLGQYFLVKFGRRFLDKLRNAFFVVENEMLDRIIASDKHLLNRRFREKFGISEEKVVVEAGYNASKWQRHSKILEQLAGLPVEVRSRMHVILPMTYGLPENDGAYVEEVKQLLKRSGLDGTVIEEYMPQNEIVELVAATSIKLNLRDTDNMNTAMLEALCAGTLIVNGAWLPYGALRRRGVYWRELESIDSLKDEMEYLVANLESERAKTINNMKIVREFLDYRNVSAQWKNVYSEMIAELTQGKD